LGTALLLVLPVLVVGVEEGEGLETALLLLLPVGGTGTNTNCAHRTSVRQEAASLEITLLSCKSDRVTCTAIAEQHNIRRHGVVGSQASIRERHVLLQHLPPIHPIRTHVNTQHLLQIYRYLGGYRATTEEESFSVCPTIRNLQIGGKRLNGLSNFRIKQHCQFQIVTNPVNGHIPNYS
jgi:hypothetical protein